MFISRPQADLSTNMGLNGALAGWAITYLAHAEDKGQFAGAFIGGLTGATLGVRIARNMTEADAVASAFGDHAADVAGTKSTKQPASATAPSEFQAHAPAAARLDAVRLNGRRQAYDGSGNGCHG